MSLRIDDTAFDFSASGDSLQGGGGRDRAGLRVRLGDLPLTAGERDSALRWVETGERIAAAAIAVVAWMAGWRSRHAGMQKSAE